jgi:hypothetical protein
MNLGAAHVANGNARIKGCDAPTWRTADANAYTLTPLAINHTASTAIHETICA